MKLFAPVVLMIMLVSAPAAAYWECGWDEKPASQDYSDAALDGMTASESSPLSLVGLFAIRAYQETLSGRIGVHCNFYPSCSRYGLHAICDYGLIRGYFLATDRISRCHGYSYLGTYERDYDLRLLLDPVIEPGADQGFWENLIDF